MYMVSKESTASIQCHIVAHVRSFQTAGFNSVISECELISTDIPVWSHKYRARNTPSHEILSF